MTAPKRWYQLSMLQLLVAMAVVAVFVVKNREVRYSFMYSEKGWPFAHWSASGVSDPTGTQWFIVLLNACLCILVVLAATKLFSVLGSER